MFSVPAEVPSAHRARWLAEVADALDQAHRLLCDLDLDSDAAPDALELRGRIEAARLQVQVLRQSRPIALPAEAGPEWTNLIPWPVKRVG
jgi:hypothetical protein